MQAGRHGEALSLFSEVITRKPEFAEGWNRRATVYYLAGELEKSIADCDEVLKRNPGHFGALSGLGQIYLALQDPDKALAAFRRALEVNPNMVGVEMQIKMLEEKTRARPGAGQAT
jgi:tetratricopeptide (TPR) repeat protein